MCKKCGCSTLCPFSLAFAVGITMGLAVFIKLVLVIYGLLPVATAAGVTLPTYKNAAVLAFFAFLNGFVYAFVVALIYDLMVVKCGKKCCTFKHREGCSCKSCTEDTCCKKEEKTEVAK